MTIEPFGGKEIVKNSTVAPQCDSQVTNYAHFSPATKRRPNTLALVQSNQNCSAEQDNTHINNLSESHIAREDGCYKNSPAKRVHTTSKAVEAVTLRHPQSEDSKHVFLRTVPYKFEYTDMNGKGCIISVPNEIKCRLDDTYEYDDENIELFFRNYFIRKYEESKRMLFPYKGPQSFYILCRTVCKITHEFFADAINVSGILDAFSSSDTCDEAFGSVGKWESAEETVCGAAGIPPFTTSITESVISSAEFHIRRSRPFCRIYLLPFEDAGPLIRGVESDSFYGDIVAVIKPRMINFRHQREFFEADSAESFRDWRPTVKTALVVWINETYRQQFPVPVDVDECFVAWAIQTVGTSTILDFDALNRAFPATCRNANEAARQLLH